MARRTVALVVVAGIAVFFASPGWADVPAPPVNQNIGMADVLIGDLEEADCRICHSSGVPERHHLLYEQPIPPGSLVPFPDADGDGNDDTIYGCLNCHDTRLPLVRDCTQCHTASPHHTAPAALGGDCVACHGDIVDNMDDGHYIPTYAPSMVTPSPSEGEADPLNSRGNGAGACDYCHDEDELATPVILENEDLHHAARDAGDFPCAWCHVGGDPEVGTDGERMRLCEGCHGLDSLHNIQVDSPNPANVGTIVVGGEDAGYGHVGRDAGPDDSDCWGCHGFPLGRAVAPGSGPIIPTISYADVSTIDAGTDTAVTLTGSSFMNVFGGTEFTSDVALTAPDGSSVRLTPERLGQGSLGVTIPGDTPAGNYKLQAIKGGFASNPAVISVTPAVIVTGASGGRTVTIHGSGFGGYAAGLGTSVTGTITTRRAKGDTTPTATTVDATIVSWSDTTIVALFDSYPHEVTVNSIFGSTVSEVNLVKKSKRGGSGR